MSKLNKSDVERLKRYISECKTCQEENIEEHVNKLRNLIEKFPQNKIKKQFQIFKALGSLIRIKIMILLLQLEEICPCELIVTFNVSQSNISHHLTILERAGLITNYTQGKWKYYRVTDKGRGISRLLE